MIPAIYATKILLVFIGGPDYGSGKEIKSESSNREVNLILIN
jgi:hypothetical protein